MLNMLSKGGMLKCRATDVPMEANVKLLPDHREILDDPDTYCRLMGKLNYLIVNKPDIVFAECFKSVSFSTMITH